MKTTTLIEAAMHSGWECTTPDNVYIFSNKSNKWEFKRKVTNAEIREREEFNLKFHIELQKLGLI